ncbi:sensor histidine kinase [Candidatus Contubernalis alkaliaceticus]|uniref:sensor histidine kinase n=1 Tax=Candidatus Contubernalis alkaliaceticus TaxID=338645 RepID=UPI001F4C1F76|nr:ATP-binding protein [Candidatus Contubernalis alkalaceticus]UNC91450.1 hypothetical protein HUE98_04720 [Candidatus Contubernalis alkalaceticus]
MINYYLLPPALRVTMAFLALSSGILSMSSTAFLAQISLVKDDAFYSALALRISLFLAVSGKLIENAFVHNMVWEGTFLPVPGQIKYLALLPAFALFWIIKVDPKKRKNDKKILSTPYQINAFTCSTCSAFLITVFIGDNSGLSAFTLSFFAACLLAFVESASYFSKLLRYTTSNFTPLALREIFDNLEEAAVLVDDKKWIEEQNKSFLKLSKKIGVPDDCHDWTRWQKYLLDHLSASGEGNELAVPDDLPVEIVLNQESKAVLKMSSHRIVKRKKETFTVVFQDVTPYVELAQQMEKVNTEIDSANQKIKKLILQIAQIAVVNERKSITQSAHDHLGNQLSVILMGAEAALSEIDNNPEKAMFFIKSVEPLLGKNWEERLPKDPLTLRDTIEVLSSLFTNIGIQIETSISNTPLPLPVDHAFAEICREAMTNSLCHGNVKTIRVSLKFEKSKVQLTISDNGKGSDSGQLKHGLGITGMRRRIENLNGFLQVENLPDEGFVVKAEAPAE